MGTLHSCSGIANARAVTRAFASTIWVDDDLRRLFDDEVSPTDEEDVRLAPLGDGVELDPLDAVDV